MGRGIYIIIYADDSPYTPMGGFGAVACHGSRLGTDCGPTTAPFDCRWAEDASSPTDRDLCSLHRGRKLCQSKVEGLGPQGGGEHHEPDRLPLGVAIHRPHGWTAGLPLASRIRTPTAPAIPEAEKIERSVLKDGLARIPTGVDERPPQESLSASSALSS